MVPEAPWKVKSSRHEASELEALWRLDTLQNKQLSEALLPRVLKLLGVVLIHKECATDSVENCDRSAGYQWCWKPREE